MSAISAENNAICRYYTANGAKSRAAGLLFRLIGTFGILPKLFKRVYNCAVDRRTNPFQPGAGNPPPVLAGRQRNLDDASVALGRTLDGVTPQSIMLTGLRGVGKTAFLNESARIAENMGFETVLIEAEDKIAFLDRVRHDIEAPLQRLASKGITDTIKTAFNALRGVSITAGSDGGVEFGLKWKPNDLVSRPLALPDLLDAFGVAARERGTGLFIAVDELQYLSSDDLGHIIMAQHRMNQRALPVLLMAAGLPQIPILAGLAKSYAERLFKFDTIGALTPEATHRAIQDAVKAKGVAFEDEAIDEIYNMTQGYPYFVQEWASDAWNVAEKSPITLADVNQASRIALRRLDEGFFRVRYDRLSPKEKKYLHAMATLGTGVKRSGDIAAVYGTPMTAVSGLRDSLIRDGVIYSPSFGLADFTVPLYDGFLKRLSLTTPSTSLS